MSKKSQVKNSKKREFSYEKQSKDRKQLERILKVPGKHNIYNGLAALAAARALGIADKISFEALAEFRGTWRRFEEIGRYKDVLVISDYAHNPAKIRALTEALICKIKKEQRQGEAIIVFQPHHQKRLETLFDDFVEAFGEAASMFQVLGFKFQALITDVYEVAGREKSEIRNSKSETNLKSKILNSKTLVDAINKKYPDANVVYVPKNKLRQYLKNMFPPCGWSPEWRQVSSPRLVGLGPTSFHPAGGHPKGDKFQVLCFAGAGDIDNFARKLLKGFVQKSES